MSYANKEIADFVKNTRVFFDNINGQPEIKLGLEEKGYLDPRLNVGRSKFLTLDELFQLHLDSVLKRDALKVKMDEQLKLAHETIQKTVQWLRRELEGDPEAMTALGLWDERQRYGEKFIKQAHSFYETAMNTPALLAKLEPMNLTTEKLQSELNLVDGYKTLYSQWRELKGECQRLVVERNKAYKAIKAWMTALTLAGKIAFSDNPQTLEKVGIYVRNSPRRKRKTEAPKEPPNEPPADPPVEPPVDPPADPPVDPPAESS